ncbi:MAG: DUF4124 domain-containing protein [Gammaproteobacteria bacterium]
MIKRIPFLLVALSLTALTAGAQDFNVYRWVDDDGVPQYTDRPPSTEEVTATGVRSRRTDPEAVTARAEQVAERNSQQAETRQQAADEAPGSAAERAQTLEERRANCASARERAETYNTAQRLYRPLPDGGREYLTDQELDNARNSADQDISAWCD